mmetsp:Transcript_8659/g.27466  ORF Transcript_8659/g.27466 Transcript_8659/m.27466 type:complete len:263 (-) Transcript_8659:515-1303(-)
MSSSAYLASTLSRCACTAVAHKARATARLRKGSDSPGREACSIPPTNCCSTSSSTAARQRWIASAFARVTERSAPDAIEPTAVLTSSSRMPCRCALSAFMFGSITCLFASSTHDTAAAAAFSARAASCGHFDLLPASAARAEQMASCSSARAQRGWWPSPPTAARSLHLAVSTASDASSESPVSAVKRAASAASSAMAAESPPTPMLMSASFSAAVLVGDGGPSPPSPYRGVPGPVAASGSSWAPYRGVPGCGSAPPPPPLS